MQRTQFATYVQKLRHENNESQHAMAKNLGVSQSFLGQVELGKKNPPSSWAIKIPKIYNLNETETEKLKEAIEISKFAYHVNVSNANLLQRRLVYLVAKSFDRVDEDTVVKMIEMLEMNGEKG